jgi:YVTN family beta-propeller protein
MRKGLAVGVAAGAVATVVVAVVLVVSGDRRRDGSERRPAIAAPVVQDEHPEGRVVRVVPTGFPVGPLVAGFGSLWLGRSHPTDAAVVRIDPAAGEVLAAVPVGGPPRALAVGAGAVWVAGGGDGASPDAWLARVDPDTDRVTGRALVAGSVDVAVAFDSVWVSGPGGVWRVDPESLRAVAAIPVEGATTLAATSTAVWVTRPDAGALDRIDPSAGAVAASVQVGPAPITVVAGPASLWVADVASGALVEIDPVTASVVARVPVAGRPSALAVDGDGRVWVTVQRTPTGAATATARTWVHHLDPATRALSAPAEVGLVLDVAATAGGLWISDLTQEAVVRIE